MELNLEPKFGREAVDELCQQCALARPRCARDDPQSLKRETTSKPVEFLEPGRPRLDHPGPTVQQLADVHHSSISGTTDNRLRLVPAERTSGVGEANWRR